MRTKISILVAVLWAIGLSAYAQQQQDNSKAIPLFFRETFKAPPVASEDVNFTEQLASSPNLEIKLYGPGAHAQPDHESGLRLANRGDGLPGSPVVSWMWSGMTEANWAVTMRDKGNYVDLTGPAKIRWRIRPRS